MALKCFVCHGPCEREGSLRFDQREAALAELDSGERAIVPGKLKQSEMLARLTTDTQSFRGIDENLLVLTVNHESIIFNTEFALGGPIAAFLCLPSAICLRNRWHIRGVVTSWQK